MVNKLFQLKNNYFYYKVFFNYFSLFTIYLFTYIVIDKIDKIVRKNQKSKNNFIRSVDKKQQK